MQLILFSLFFKLIFFKHLKYSINTECGLRNIDCHTGNGEDYRGKVSATKSGKTCQSWNSQTPHEHEHGHLGNHNQCRNPDGEAGPWCYTTVSNKRWEHCNVKKCSGCEIGTSFHSPF